MELRLMRYSTRDQYVNLILYQNSMLYARVESCDKFWVVVGTPG